MDINAALAQYLEICNNNSGFLQCHLTKNSVLEWFGRPIRNRHRIQQFFRYTVCQQYEHVNFQNAQVCGPIQDRSSHCKISDFTAEDNEIQEIFEAAKEEGPDDIEMHASTPTQDRQTPELPGVTRGKEFLPESADGFNEPGISKLIDDAITPPRRTSELVNFDAPMSKKSKPSVDYGGTISPLPNVEAYFKRKTTNVKRLHGGRTCSSSGPSPAASTTSRAIFEPATLAESTATHNGFSEVMYLEVRGIIQRLNKTKHRGITGSSHALGSSSTSPLNRSSSGERETNLKIAYRIRLHDKFMQIAHIIYEHIAKNPTLRRNLLSAFEDANQSESEEPEFAKKTQLTPLKRKKILKRDLRRLF